VDLYYDHLTPRERIWLRLSRIFRAGTPVAWVRWRVMQPVIHYVLGPLKRRVVTPLLTWCGDLLERIPERWRPPIRTRDRVARRQPMNGDHAARRSPLLSPIGLEPVTNDPGPELTPEWSVLQPAGARTSPDGK
jgi:hypothetical protein